MNVVFSIKFFFHLYHQLSFLLEPPTISDLVQCILNYLNLILCFMFLFILYFAFQICHSLPKFKSLASHCCFSCIFFLSKRQKCFQVLISPGTVPEVKTRFSSPQQGFPQQYIRGLSQNITILYLKSIKLKSLVSYNFLNGRNFSSSRSKLSPETIFYSVCIDTYTDFIQNRFKKQS